MTNTYPRCHHPPGVNTGVPVANDRTAANNNGVIVNASTIVQEESIQAQALDTNQHCCNEPPNINSPRDGDSMLLHGEDMLNNIRENVRLLIDQEIEKWDIEIYTFMCKVGQLTNDLAALVKNRNHLRGQCNVDNKIAEFSWWKSGCKQECRLSIDQELYHPSGVAHLDENKSTSSTTTQVAAATYLDNQNDWKVLSNVGNGIRCQTFDDSDCFDSATVEAELLGTNSGLMGPRGTPTTCHNQHGASWSYSFGQI
jgi:hypothetical protein